MSALLAVAGLGKRFGEQVVLRDISVELNAGEVLAVLGRSGCGKTTLLKILAGLEVPDAGTLSLHGKDLRPVPPNERQMVYLYQEPLLFPHFTVFENVAFGLRIRKMPQAEITKEVTILLDELELSAHAQKAPHQLSGGSGSGYRSGGRLSSGRACCCSMSLLATSMPRPAPICNNCFSG
nr:ATP-binding cassette domain-containing protein [Hymenobacter sp. BRD67]